MAKISKAEFDALPDSLKTKFKAEGDNYVLEEPDVSGLKKNKDELLKELKELKDKYGDIDPEAARQALNAHNVAEEEKARAAGEFDKLKEQLEARHKTELEAATTKSQSILSNLRREKIAALAVAKGIMPGRVKSAIAEGDLDAILDLNDEDFSIYKKGGIGDAKEVDEIFDNLKTKAAWVFEGNGASGSGAQGSEQTQTGVDLNSMTPIQMLEMVNTK